MWSEGDWFHDGVVGGVADEGLCEVVDDGIGRGEEYVSAIGVYCDSCELAATFFGVFFGCWSPAIEESFDHGAVLDTDVCRCWRKVLDPSVEVGDNMSGQVMVVSCGCLGVVDGQYSSNFPSLFLKSSSLSFCLRILSSLSKADSIWFAGACKVTAGVGGVVRRVISDSSSRYRIFWVASLCLILLCRVAHCCLFLP